MTPLRLRVTGSGALVETEPQHLIVAGYTGRDEAATRAHITELAAIGVPAPPTVPAFYRLDPSLLTTEPVIGVVGDNTSGEAEPVLIRRSGRYFLAVGSDHTDRDIERSGIAAAKAACPKPLGDLVAELPADLGATPWDAMRIESSVDGRPYQAGTLSALRTPADLLGRLWESVGGVDGDLVLFAGTVPLLDGGFVPGKRWHLALTTGNTTLSCSYVCKHSEGRSEQ